MQRILLVLAIGAFTTLATATASRAEIVTNTRIPFTDFIGFVPCANGGAGEFIVGAGGELHILIALTENGNAVSRERALSTAGRDRSGLEHRRHLSRNGCDAEPVHIHKRPNGHVRQQLPPDRARTGNNFLVHETFHFTVNANGDTTVVHDNFSIECK